MKKIILSKNQYKTLLESLNQEPIVKGGLDRVSDMSKKYNLKEEYKNLLEYLYGKSKNLSEFWNESNVKYEAVLEGLKDILVKEKDGYKLSKKLGSPQDALKIYEERLNEIVGGLNEGDWFDNLDDNPINQKPEPKLKASSPKSNVEIKFNNGDIAIVPTDNGLSYIDLDDYNSEFMKAVQGEKSELNSIAVELGYAEDSKDGYWTNNDDQINQVLKNYIEAKSDKIIPIDDKVKTDLLDFYSHDDELNNLLNGEGEENSLNEYGGSDDKEIKNIKQQLGRGFTATDKPKTDVSADALAARKNITGDHETGGFGGNFLNRKKKVLPKVQPPSKNPEYTQTRLPFDEATTAGAIGGGVSVFGGGGAGARLNHPVPQFGKPLKRTFKNENLNETTQGEGSIGQYDANALPIGRNGEFKKVGKTKAETTPQYAGGAFVEFNDCTKLNNKPAGSGCSAGAVDGVVKLKKAKGSINAPSLGENKIYETIAKQTGKTIDEVKRIIELKNNK